MNTAFIGRRSQWAGVIMGGFQSSPNPVQDRLVLFHRFVKQPHGNVVIRLLDNSGLEVEANVPSRIIGALPSDQTVSESTVSEFANASNSRRFTVDSR